VLHLTRTAADTLWVCLSALLPGHLSTRFIYYAPALFFNSAALVETWDDAVTWRLSGTANRAYWAHARSTCHPTLTCKIFNATTPATCLPLSVGVN